MKWSCWVLCLFVNILSLDASLNNVKTYITMGSTSWGNWSERIICASGSRVAGFRLQVQENQGSDDDSALNGIQLACTDGNVTKQIEGPFGSWKSWKYCNDGAGFAKGSVSVIGFNFNSERDYGSGDDTAGNDVRMICNNTQMLDGGGTDWGDWAFGSYRTCPAYTYFCGLQAKVQGFQGDGDDTGLNKLRFLCCSAGDCPSTHPYAFNDGRLCCEFDRTFDGGQLYVNSTTCKERTSTSCTALPCSNNDTAIQRREKCPADYPYAFHLGEHCCANGLNATGALKTHGTSYCVKNVSCHGNECVNNDTAIDALHAFKLVSRGAVYNGWRIATRADIDYLMLDLKEYFTARPQFKSVFIGFQGGTVELMSNNALEVRDSSKERDVIIVVQEYNLTAADKWTCVCGNSTRKMSFYCNKEELVHYSACVEKNTPSQCLHVLSKCVYYTTWSAWNATKDCGVYARRRERQCVTNDGAAWNDSLCNMKFNDTLGNIQEGMHDTNNSCYYFTEWNQWVNTKKCGYIPRYRTRLCYRTRDHRGVHASFCKKYGESFMRGGIYSGISCYYWSSWWNATSCIGACGHGYQIQKRNCSSHNIKAIAILEHCKSLEGAHVRNASCFTGRQCDRTASITLLFTFTKKDYHENFNLYLETIKNEINKELTSEPSDFTYSADFANSADDDGVIVHIHVNYEYNDDATKLEYGIKFKKTIVPTLSKLFDKSVVLDKSDCCFEETVGDDDYKGRYTFNTTLMGRRVTLPCKYNRKNIVTRACLQSEFGAGGWGTIEMNECSPKHAATQKLIDLNKKPFCSDLITSDCIEITAAVEALSNIVSSGSSVRSHKDISFAANIVANIVANITGPAAVKVSGTVVGVFSNILDVPPDFMKRSELEDNSATKLLNNLDVLALKIGDTFNKQNNSLSVAKQNIAFRVLLANQSDTTLYSTAPANQNGSISASDDNKERELFGSVFLPKSAFSDSNEIITSVTHLKPTLFVKKNDDKNEFKNDVKNEGSSRDAEVQSAVIAVSIGNKTISSLHQPVVLKFKKTSNHRDSKDRSLCVFWNFNRGGQQGGDWSTSGCTLKSESHDTVTCHCTHLTNFALLFDVYQKGDSELLDLTEVTVVGCTISIICLVLAILTHSVSRKLRQKLPSKILVSICASLLLLLVTFMSGIRRSEHQLSCRVTSAMLHYFLLAKFLWATMGALNLQRLVVGMVRRSPRDEMLFFLRSSLFAWGVPVIIVLITALSKPENLITNSVCFVYGLSFYLGVVLPVSLSFVVNITTLSIVLMKIAKSSEAAAGAVKQLNNTRIAMANICLFGLTWTLAIFAIDHASHFFQILFCIFASLQGFFIFGFFVIMNDAARAEWVRFANTFKQKKKIGTAMSELNKKTQTSPLH